MPSSAINRIRYEFNLLLLAISFFTRIPVTQWVDFKSSYLNQASRYFPWVGWLVAATGILALLLTQPFFPLEIALLFSMIATVLVTGAFHEDGLADTCDGFGGGWKPPQVLSIMKDSRLGTYGAVGLSLTLGLKFLLLNQLDLPSLIAALAVGHVVSRFVAVTFLRDLAYVQDTDASKSKPLAVQLSDQSLLIAALAVLPVLFLLTWQEIVIGLLGLLLIRLSLAWYFNRRIGGYTGDCLGAAQQISEIGCYMVLVAV